MADTTAKVDEAHAATATAGDKRKRDEDDTAAAAGDAGEVVGDASDAPDEKKAREDTVIDPDAVLKQLKVSTHAKLDVGVCPRVTTTRAHARYTSHNFERVRSHGCRGTYPPCLMPTIECGRRWAVGLCSSMMIAWAATTA